MPTCRTCLNWFANRAIVEGIPRTLSSRKHCLVCSPFGKHNTKVSLGEADGCCISRDCTVCGKRFVPSRSRGDRATRCNTCVVHKYRESVKAKAIAYKGGCCVSCGYDKCSAALQFHHLDSKLKDFTIGGNHTRTWGKIQAELDKCILICANCHAEIHAKRALLVQRLVQ